MQKVYVSFYGLYTSIHYIFEDLIRQADFSSGLLGRDEYLSVSRRALAALDEVEDNRKTVANFEDAH